MLLARRSNGKHGREKSVGGNAGSLSRQIAMAENVKLVFIKIVHTIVWVFFNVVIFYLLYAVVVNKIDKWVWICITLVFLEGIILIVFKNICPVTLIARKFSNSKQDNFDIYLPNWLAKYNKEIYSIIVLIAIVILIYRLSTSS